MTIISTQSMTSSLRTSINQMQAALTQAQTELSTGAPADLGLTLGASTGYALSLTSSIDALSAYTQNNALASTRLSSTSSALGSILSSAQTMEANLTTASNAGGITSSLTSSAQGSLQSLIAGLNTTVSGQSIFGGINTATTPISDYFASGSGAKSAVDTAFQNAFGTSQTSEAAGSISGSAMQSFLTNQFASLFTGSNWSSDWSSASSQAISSQVSPSQSVSSSVSANQTAFQQIAEAYTMVTEFTGSNMSADAKAAVVSTASALMSSGIAGLNNLQTGVGLAQDAVSNADSQNNAQTSVLQTNVSDLESVNTYALSTQVTQLQTQLEASYELTSQLHQLSLVNYLSNG